MKTLEFIYQETQIHFLLNSNNKNVMVNATEMAKLFNKRTGHFLANKETKDTISALERADISVHSDSKIVDNRGHVGIYFHRLLAIDFASWLDKDFKVWMLMTIDKILFSQNQKVASVVTKRQEAIALKEQLIKQVKANNNTEALELLEVVNQIQRLQYQQTKVLKEFSNQYKLPFTNA